MISARAAFGREVTRLLDRHEDAALVWAEIGSRFFPQAIRNHPERVINVGIREQLLVSVGAGLALAGMRPIVHTFSSFLVERAFEQIKLDFCHQGVGGVLVGTGGSFDGPTAGRTHQSPGDVALMDTLDATIHAPGHPEEVAAVLRRALGSSGLHYVRLAEERNALAFIEPGVHVVRRGAGPMVLVFGGLMDASLAATEHLDPTVLYATTVRPYDGSVLRELIVSPEVIVIEPWLEGTSARVVAEALSDRPVRLLALGVGRRELRRYGSHREHLAAHGLDAKGLRGRIDAWL
ncbi:MAG: transketolase [Nocardioides sp.]